MTTRIRPVALAVIQRGASEILVFEAEDETETPSTFYRPFGGGIEFGETSEQALRREVREELGVELSSVTLLGVLENVFRFRGTRGHEICFVYEAHTNDESLQAQDRFVTREADGEEVSGCWIDLATRVDLPGPLYPAGIAELIEAACQRPSSSSAT